jgi:S-adenosylmethionine decarboxylase
MKTCGTTTLLLCLPYLFELLEEHKFEVLFFFFRHKNFTWPELQLFPHGNFEEEIEYLNNFFENGKGIPFLI